MLINVRKEGDVITLKLSSGEEIIGSFKDEDANYYIVDRPVSLTAGPQGQPALVPYLMTVNPASARDLRFNKAMVVVVATTEKDLANQYTSALSGIQLAPAGFKL